VSFTSFLLPASKKSDSFNLKQKPMKAILIKAALYIPVTFFVVYILLMVIGGVTCACSADAQPYCTVFCLVAKILIGASVLAILGLIAKEWHREYKKSHSFQA